MVVRRLGASPAGSAAAEALRRFNARHPWSHNDYFHGWILTRLPRERRRALDVGCGRGELAAALAPHFSHVEATDTDSEMCQAAARRTAGLDNVTITVGGMAAYTGTFDLITMVAVLHHLDLDDALSQVDRLLAPDGTFLVVGLASPRSLLDHLWDLASTVTNPIIGFIHRPWPSTEKVHTPPFPVAEPTIGFAELERVIRPRMPGAIFRRHVGFRFTIEWTKPT